MAQPLDITGERYGLLVAVRKTEVRTYPSGQKRGIWLFKCDCGNEVEKTLLDVRRGSTKSCGCGRSGKPAANRLAHGEASFRGLIAKYKHSAKVRGHSWGLTKESFREITKLACIYCGTPPSQRARAQKDVFGDYTYTGVDRIQNNLGYEPGNVVPCCEPCNRAKGTQSMADFLAWAERVHSHQLAGRVMSCE
jgi:hypothetical protein